MYIEQNHVKTNTDEFWYLLAGLELAIRIYVWEDYECVI